MTNRRVLLAACGLYCGDCYHCRASFVEGEHLLEEAARQRWPLEGFTWHGCRSDVLYVHPGCARCGIRVILHHCPTRSIASAVASRGVA